MNGEGREKLVGESKREKRREIGREKRRKKFPRRTRKLDNIVCDRERERDGVKKEMIKGTDGDVGVKKTTEKIFGKFDPRVKLTKKAEDGETTVS